MDNISNKNYGLTDTGKERERNEDYFLVDLKKRIFIVADGMGGHSGGEVASRLAVETAHAHFTGKVISQMTGNPQAAESELKKSFFKAHDKVRKEAAANSAYRGMGCTLVAAFFDRPELHLCHVGDARAYLCDTENIRLLTTDHSVVMRLVQAGDMTLEEARNSEIKNELTQAIGAHMPLMPGYTRHTLKPGDKVLLCSDGLWDMLSDQEIHTILKQDKSAQSICHELIKAANQAGGYDNITAAIFIYKEESLKSDAQPEAEKKQEE